MRASLILSSLLLLTACQVTDGPNVWPSGNTYLYDEYKTGPGPKSADIGYAYSEDKNKAILLQFEEVARGMITQLENVANVQANTMYVEPLPLKSGAFHTSFDYALRLALRKKGYTLRTSPVGALTMRSEVVRHIDDRAADDFHVNEGHEDVKGASDKADPAHNPEELEKQSPAVTLTLLSGEDVIGSLSGEYDLPAYGYKKPDTLNFNKFTGGTPGKPKR